MYTYDKLINLFRSFKTHETSCSVCPKADTSGCILDHLSKGIKHFLDYF